MPGCSTDILNAMRTLCQSTAHLQVCITRLPDGSLLQMSHTSQGVTCLCTGVLCAAAASVLRGHAADAVWRLCPAAGGAAAGAHHAAARAPGLLRHRARGAPARAHHGLQGTFADTYVLWWGECKVLRVQTDRICAVSAKDLTSNWEIEEGRREMYGRYVFKIRRWATCLANQGC